MHGWSVTHSLRSEIALLAARYRAAKILAVETRVGSAVPISPGRLRDLPCGHRSQDLFTVWSRRR